MINVLMLVRTCIKSISFDFRIFPLVLNMSRILPLLPLGKVAKVVVQMELREETSLLA